MMDPFLNYPFTEMLFIIENIQEEYVGLYSVIWKIVIRLHPVH